MWLYRAERKTTQRVARKDATTAVWKEEEKRHPGLL